jgi:two-component sensor histidine kinase
VPTAAGAIDAPDPDPDLGPASAPRWRRFEVGLVLVWWSIFGITLTIQTLADAAQQGVPMTIATAGARAFFGAGVWAGITLVIFVLVRRFPLDGPHRARAIIVHFAAGMVIGFTEVAITYVVFYRLFGGGGEGFYALFSYAFPGNLVYYWLFVGVGHGLRFYRYYRLREAHNALLSKRLVQAELQMLKSQLHPHFLFNTLHAVSALIHKDPKAADRMLARLSQLLRVALDYSGTQEVSLQEELEFLAPYLEIERVRLGDRLSVEMNVQPGVLDARVPHMILQPLVENAIRHGIAPRVTPGRIFIGARGRRDMLDLEVSDDGPGLPPGRSANGGLGLTNTRARLEQLYGDAFLFEPHNIPGGGFRVAITIPFRPAYPARTDESPEVV